MPRPVQVHPGPSSTRAQPPSLPSVTLSFKPRSNPDLRLSKGVLDEELPVPSGGIASRCTSSTGELHLTKSFPSRSLSVVSSIHPKLSVLKLSVPFVLQNPTEALVRLFRQHAAECVSVCSGTAAAKDGLVLQLGELSQTLATVVRKAQTREEEIIRKVGHY